MEKRIDRHDLEWKEEILKQLIAIGDPDEIAAFAEEYFLGVIRRAIYAEARVRVLEEALEELLAKVQFYMAHEWPSDMEWIEIFLCCTLNDLKGGKPDDLPPQG